MLCPHLCICSLQPHETPWPEAADPPLLPWEVLAPLLLAVLPGPSETKPFHHSQRKSHHGGRQSLLSGWAQLSPCCSGDDERLGEWPGCSLLLQFAQCTLQPLDDFLIKVASLDCPPCADSSITRCWHHCADHRHWSRLPYCPSAPQTAAPPWPGGSSSDHAKGPRFPWSNPRAACLLTLPSSPSSSPVFHPPCCHPQPSSHIRDPSKLHPQSAGCWVRARGEPDGSQAPASRRYSYNGASPAPVHAPALLLPRVMPPGPLSRSLLQGSTMSWVPVPCNWDRAEHDKASPEQGQRGSEMDPGHQEPGLPQQHPVSQHLEV